MTNSEKAALLRSAASALEHGRIHTANLKLRHVTDGELLSVRTQLDAEEQDNRNLYATLKTIIKASEAVIANWESGNLAEAVNGLADAIKEAKHPDTDWHRAGCANCQYVYDSKLPD